MGLGLRLLLRLLLLEDLRRSRAGDLLGLRLLLLLLLLLLLRLDLRRGDGELFFLGDLLRLLLLFLGDLLRLVLLFLLSSSSLTVMMQPRKLDPSSSLIDLFKSS